MTEKNIFAYKLFLPLNISDFNLFSMGRGGAHYEYGTVLYEKVTLDSE